jgi:GxxExxY protein
MDAKDRLNAITEGIIGAAIAVHRALGPGLLESAYEACLAFELVKRGYAIERQKPLPLVYEGVEIDCAYGLDLVVNDDVIWKPRQSSDSRTYMKLRCCRICVCIADRLAC